MPANLCCSRTACYAQFAEADRFGILYVKDPAQSWSYCSRECFNRDQADYADRITGHLIEQTGNDELRRSIVALTQELRAMRELLQQTRDDLAQLASKQAGGVLGALRKLAGGG